MTTATMAPISPLPPVSGLWWPCFICDSVDRCCHREPEIVAWMRLARKTEQETK